MKIAQLTPGSGDTFYCENCLRDIALVRALHRRGHKVELLPMYLPVQADARDHIDTAPIFFGGVNVYLQEKLSLFRHTPRWLDRLFDSPRMLAWAGRKAGMTSARDLGETTVSMLRGEHGHQRKELARLLEWLKADANRPDVVVLSNLLLGGLAGSLRVELGVPVVCLLQDEDGFLDGLISPFREQAWELVQGATVNIDAFVAVSQYYADAMGQRLGVEENAIQVVHTGVVADDYEPAQARPTVPTIGFLSRMCAERGLDLLVEAFVKLKNTGKVKNARLRIAGGKSASDQPFIERMIEKLRSRDLAGDVEWLEDFTEDAKRDFLNSLSVLCVPEKSPVACGLYVLEAWACGVPVVEPDSGVFGELMYRAAGGLLYRANDVEQLTDALERVLSDGQEAPAMGRRGRDAVVEYFNVERQARDLVEIFEQVVEGG